MIELSEAPNAFVGVDPRRGRAKSMSSTKQVMRRIRWAVPFAAVLALFVFSSAALAMPTMMDGSGPSGPWILSDQGDYAPGSTVHLTSGGWQPGEAVQIFTNDSVGNTWSKTDNVTADSSGLLTDDVTLPNSFIANYSVTATGASGATATATFTDGNVTTVSGAVTDSVTHLAIAGATVTCDTTTGCNATFSATTDSSGHYSFSSISNNKLTFSGNGPATLKLKVSKTGYADGTITLTNVTSGDSFTSEDIALAPTCSAASITTQPTNQSITYGSNATFTAAG